MPEPMNLKRLVTELDLLLDRHGSTMLVYIEQSQEVNADYYPPDVLAIQSVEVTQILVHPVRLRSDSDLITGSGVGEDTEMSTCILIKGKFDA